MRVDSDDCACPTPIPWPHVESDDLRLKGERERRVDEICIANDQVGQGEWNEEAACERARTAKKRKRGDEPFRGE